LYSSVLASSEIAVPDTGSRTEKGPAGRPLDAEYKLASECKTQEECIPGKGSVSSWCIRFYFLCTVFISDKQ
jgi:hypothetical protein